jgi:predicted transcriptional regulator of viral defense system
MSDNEREIYALVRKHGIVRTRDLKAWGKHPEYLRRLTAKGLLLRLGRGTYVAADHEINEHHAIAETAKRLPGGVVCLLSALQFHEIGTQAPHEVWIALRKGSKTPKAGDIPIRVVFFSGEAFEAGTEKHLLEGVDVRMTTPAKTVADCFKFRNKIGIDVAIEALRDCLGSRRCTADEIMECARVCRVQNVIRPYIQVLL